jgi:AcrR family transcriptional regulator
MHDIRVRWQAAPKPDEIRAAVVAAVEAGVPVTVIAEETGISRAALYRYYLNEGR